jgi:transposase
MYYIGLDIHKKAISYCVKDAAGRVQMEGKIGSTRQQLDDWVRDLPQPRQIAMEATVFTGWIYDHLLPHARSGEGRSSVDVAGHCSGQEEE